MKIKTTNHAKVRIAQRGVATQALELLALHGVDFPAGSGCVRRELLHWQVSDLHNQGYAIAIIEKALRLEAIFTDGDILITCYQRSPKAAAERNPRGRKGRRATTRKWGM
ncbi:MAG: hypothetical protein EP341_04020 [Sphingomonadales bacterium]|nr:MAG: hypothetical protein EP341_04020 [Sphingomonadales bacterium]